MSVIKSIAGLYLADVMDDAVICGGGTYEFINGGWFRLIATSGYMVSDPGGIENVPGFPYNNADSLAALVRTFWAKTQNTPSPTNVPRGIYLGLWKDENGNWSIDRSHHFAQRNTAVMIAKENQQRAIWDCAASITVPVA